ncbi:hypothetical protein HTS88_08570 [Pseudarthrobacter oxydans]|uniref:hypothetical protein n=1 Tax=Pseudarthrobacter oxydans TaxID=1671 RepID=UPI001571AFC4|nr:hypothetical protein [Pseudarthrobacter oxydans]NSX36462.1 hypothetical protein [Pseudarthrobacter oxydans]
MESEILKYLTAMTHDPLARSVIGAVLAFLAINVLKGTGKWLWLSLTNIPKRLSRWADRQQSML